MLRSIPLAVLVVILSVLLVTANPSLGRRHRAAQSNKLPAGIVKYDAPADGSFNVDASSSLVDVSPDLYGIFFEEINHAGVGGLYAQQVMNANFETRLQTTDPWKAIPAPTSVQYKLSLDTTMPLTPANPTSMKVHTADSNAPSTVGVMNPGFWGIPTAGIKSFNVSLFAYSSSVMSLTLSIQSTTGRIYGSSVVTGVSSMWQSFNTIINVNSNDESAELVVSWQTTGASTDVYLDVVSLFPTMGWRGLSFIRPDLGELVAGLHPSFVRFPGGCYVEGDNLADRFNWKNAIGAQEDRHGHWDLWNYWSEDGLGLFEYLMFIEQLTDAYGNPTRAIWVINNGVSHSQSVPTANISTYVQDALDSIEFAQGSTSSSWGQLRAQMGHPAPFHIDYLAIGNEDCGKPDYDGNYMAFYTAIKSAYPNIKLICNCLDSNVQVDFYDYHIYTSPQDFINKQHTFDNADRKYKIFNSEYAVTSNPDHYTLNAALGEAVWMTGLERNSDVVVAASYAPLFVNDHDHTWDPNAITFNASQSFGSPSYWLQYTFTRSFDGCVSGSAHTLSYSASNTSSALAYAAASCMLTPAAAKEHNATTMYVMKFVNLAQANATISVQLNKLPSNAVVQPTARSIVLSSKSTSDVNTFADPYLVAPVDTAVPAAAMFPYVLPPFSIDVLRVFVAQ